ncbi:MAG: hypothetical protein KJ718_03385 [Nanoarchaeota archaeon]|nr:hypothetical protein [Nanoarchaeota archaeon]MBU1051572.1 hypothetical protein [Nanoarchaeota archaeon]MBU1989045.1 hypothetical protein [Nanoarchaeota archaeon]
MASKEWAQVLAAILLLFVIAGLPSVFRGDALVMTQVFVFSFVIVLASVIAKKAMAYSLDLSVEHRIWHFYRFGIKPKMHFKREVPFGVIVPLFFAVLGVIAKFPFMVMTFLTYEARALKHRAAKRFGLYSYTEMTDWHNGLIGAVGVVVLLVLALIGYFIDFEILAKMAAYYAFWSMIPFSDLDGTQIFFGNKTLWTVLAVITFVFAGYAMVL